MPSDALLRFTLYCAVVVGMMALALLLQVLLLSTLTRRRQRHRAQLEINWRPYLAGVALGDAITKAPALANAHRFWFLVLWCRMQRNLRGSPRDRLNTLLVHLGLDRFALEATREASARKQLIGLTTLRYLGHFEHWRTVADKVSDKNPIIAMAAAETLVRLDPQQAMAVLMSVMLSRNDWSSVQVATLLRSAGTAALTAKLKLELEKLLAAPDHQPAFARRRLLKLLPLGDQAQLAPLIRRLLGTGEAEAVSVALKCLGENSDPRDRTAFIDHLSHPESEVRGMAAEALGSVVEARDLEALLERVTDRDWWVRQQAARAIAKIPGQRQRLDQLSEHIADPYGREALVYAFSERVS